MGVVVRGRVGLDCRWGSSVGSSGVLGVEVVLVRIWSGGAREVMRAGGRVAGMDWEAEGLRASGMELGGLYW